LERSIISFDIHGEASATLVGIVTNGHNYSLTRAVLNEGALEEERARVVPEVLLVEGLLDHRFWLTSESGLVTAELFAIDDDTVCGDCVALLELDNVANDEFL